MEKSNRLLQETSPYLKQHAYNPVDWYPWGEEALKKARIENKPILLSIGYSACHWCHVMAHESFEEQDTAHLMNELFVNIKVDREERPDLDKIYQTAHYLLMQQSGGWPLTIFLTPDDLTPFFSGTYFPLVPRYQIPAFKDVLRGLAKFYREHPTDIKKQNSELMKILQHKGPATQAVQLDDSPLRLAISHLQNHFDPVYGGFSPAPKFPQPTILEFLLMNNSFKAKETLQHMDAGGIYDQLGGGFFRYSVDTKWEIPHFEKMLYDNGQLTKIYAQASQAFHGPAFLKIACECADWIIKHMQSKEGGYFSSISADSEGREGKYYVWTREEIEALLTKEEFAFVQRYFGLDQAPNFENEWHLHVVKPFASIIKELNIATNEAPHLFHSAKIKLLSAREKRIAPDIDEKILTAWNALMIKGMLFVYNFTHEERFYHSAQSALSLIQEKLWREHRLLASYKDGQAKFSAYLDDYAYLLDALIIFLQVKWHKQHLLFAIELANILLEQFYDNNNGGFFFTAHDHEKLLYRPKSMMDEANPSGNGMAVRALLTLGHLLGDERYLAAAYKTLQATWPYLNQFPEAHCSLLLGLKEFLTPSTFVIIRGEKNEMEKWREQSRPLQNFVFTIPSDESDLPGFLNERKVRGTVCAYLCHGLQCEAPIDDLDEFKKIIQSLS